MQPMKDVNSTLLPGFAPTSSVERPRTAVLQSAGQPYFASAEQPGSDDEAGSKQQKVSRKPIFRPLEGYVARCFSGCATLNTSFFTIRLQNSAGELSEKSTSTLAHASGTDKKAPLSELDAKTLLLGDFAENGFWWTGSRLERDRAGSGQRRPKSPELGKGLVNAKTPHINWAELTEWYRLVTQAGSTWRDKSGGTGNARGEDYRADTAVNTAPTTFGNFQKAGNLKPKGANLTEGDIPETKTFTGDVGGPHDPARVAERKMLSRDADAAGAGGARQYETERTTGEFDVLSPEKPID
jgi:hypothetical protein